MPTCSNPECQQRFTTKRKWQRFCSSSCRNRFNGKARSRRFPGPTAFKVLEAAMAWYDDEGTFITHDALVAACSSHQDATHQEEEA